MRIITKIKSAATLVIVLACVWQANAQQPSSKFCVDKVISTTDDSQFTFINNSEGANRYSWITGDGAIVSDVDHLTWQYADLGFYRVGLVAYSEEKADTSYVDITVLRGLNNGNTVVNPTGGIVMPALSYGANSEQD